MPADDPGSHRRATLVRPRAGPFRAAGPNPVWAFLLKSDPRFWLGYVGQACQGCRRRAGGAYLGDTTACWRLGQPTESDRHQRFGRNHARAAKRADARGSKLTEVVKITRGRLPACVLLIVLATGAVCLSASAGQLSSPPEFVVVPEVEAVNLYTGFAELRQLGFQVALTHATTLRGSNVPITARVTPAPGTRVRRGSVVGSPLFLEGSRTSAFDVRSPVRLRVPNFVGKPPSAAAKWASDNSINWDIPHLPPCRHRALLHCSALTASSASNRHPEECCAGLPRN